MAVQVCPRCQRANPQAARFCYHDGNVLGQGPLPDYALLPGQLAQEFLFPSGRRCRTIEDLGQGCQQEWEAARTLLYQGDMARYLMRIGRADLASYAQDAQIEGDADMALYNFLRQLPVSPAPGPRLDLSPRRLRLGPFRAGEQHQARIRILNQGRGLLQGKLAVSTGDSWLKVAGPDEASQAIKAQRDQEVALRVDARKLTAGQTYSGKLTVVSNGGIIEVPVRLELAAAPFTRPPFQGASTPRDLAQRMLTNPKLAVPLLENGEVAKWFNANGWSYPVPGATARGVAAVQQFFECMGLSKPPPLQLSEREMRFECRTPEVMRGQVTLRTSTRKWVYALVDSNAPWLRVSTPNVSGPQQAQIVYEIDPQQLPAGRVHQGAVQVRANAGQRLEVNVRIDVLRSPRSLLGQLLRPLLVGAVPMLIYRVLLAIPGDLFARLIKAPRNAGIVPGSLAFWTSPPGADDGFLAYFVLASWWLGALLGLGFVWRGGGKITDLFCGLVAGAFAGLIGAATLGCLVSALDVFPRTLLWGLGKAAGDMAPGLATSLWLMTAPCTWALLGGALGWLLCSLGPAGVRVLAALAGPLRGLFQAMGLKGLATYFALQ